MADSGGDGVAHSRAVPSAVHAAGGAGDIILCGIRKYGKLFRQRHIHLDIHVESPSFEKN